jgi:hypothetical protein
MRTKQSLTSNLPPCRWCIVLLVFVYALYGCGGNNTPALPIIDIPPSFTALPTPVSIAENQTAVTTVSAYDPEGKSLIYSLTGTDASALSISTSGVITFNTAPDYETKNTYTVIVNVSDGTNLASPQTLNINITNVADVWIQKGLDIDGEAVDNFSGHAVSLNNDGTVVAIGAPWNNGNGDNAGHTRVYAWNGTAWIQRGLDIDGEAAGDLSGLSISLSSDGTVLAIGAYSNDGNGNNSGHVRVYAWNGTTWIQRGLDIDGEAADDLSGRPVLLSSDGTVVAIGGSHNDGNGVKSGHVRVYAWNGTAWIQRGLDIDGEAAFDYSGTKVSLSSDGTIVAIGAGSNNGNGVKSGHVRVYAWNGTAWIQRGLDIDGEAAGDKSGNVSISSDGTTLAIGATENDGNEDNAGHVRVYAWNGTAWIQKGLDIDGEAAGDKSGNSVSLSSDGTIVAIGALYNYGDDVGHTRVYAWNGTAWIQRGLDIDGEAAGDLSGNAVSLSSDGTILAVGAKRNDGNGDNAGHVRVFSFN